MRRSTGFARVAEAQAVHRGVQLALPVPPETPDRAGAGPRLSAPAAMGMRRALELAEDRGDHGVTPAHLLLGILCQPACAAATILDEHEVGATRLSSHLMPLLPPAQGRSSGNTSQASPEVERCARIAASEAAAAHAATTTTAHLLLGILNDVDSVLARLFGDLGITPRGVRAATRRHPESPELART